MDKRYITGSAYDGLPLVSFEKVDKPFPPNQHNVFVAVGYANGNRTREEKCRAAQDRGYELTTYVSSKVIDIRGCRKICWIVKFSKVALRQTHQA